MVIERDGLYGIGHIEYLPDLPEKKATSSWAHDKVVDAIEEGLVPVDLQNLYRSDITRMELTRVMVQTVESALGQDIAAYTLGIIAGKGNGIFDPNGTAARQELAVTLANTAAVIGIDMTSIEGTVFADRDQTAGWAIEAVSFISHYGIMVGTGNDEFDPLSACTRQQVYITALRLVQVAEE